MNRKYVTTGNILLAGILALAAFLLAFRITELMMFIGDFGWFYVSANSFLTTGVVPLVGIPSSHPWLHQGPLWTYLLSGALLVSQGDPLAGGRLAILFGLGSVFLMYITGKIMFTEKIGLIAAALYATSPLVIIHARMPYHTAPIPFFTLLLLLSLVMWIRGRTGFFPLALLSLSMLYNLELATIIYIALIGLLIGYGLLRKTEWMKALGNRKMIGISLVAFITPLLPILTYDTQHGYPQTLRFGMWIGYKVLTLFGYPHLHPEILTASFGEVAVFFLQHLHKLLFLPSVLLTMLIFVSSIGFVLYTLYRSYRVKAVSVGLTLLALFLVLGIGGFFATKTTSEAYLPMLFPQILLGCAFLFSSGLTRAKTRIFTYLFIAVIMLGNIGVLLNNNYLMGVPVGGYGIPYKDRVSSARSIMKQAGQNEYTMVGVGPGSQFPSYLMSYEYLTSWMGHGPSKKPQALRFYIKETPVQVTIERKDKK